MGIIGENTLWTSTIGWEILGFILFIKLEKRSNLKFGFRVKKKQRKRKQIDILLEI